MDLHPADSAASAPATDRDELHSGVLHADQDWLTVSTGKFTPSRDGDREAPLREGIGRHSGM